MKGSERVLCAAAVVAAGSVALYYYSRKKPQNVLKVTDSSSAAVLSDTATPVTILYGTSTGTSKRFAEALCRDIFALNVSGYAFKPRVLDMASLEGEDLEKEAIVIIVMSTFTDGTPPPPAVSLCGWLADAAVDFRMSKAFLGKLKYAVFGQGSTEYDAATFCAPARQLSESLQALGATALCDAAYGDAAAFGSNHLEAVFRQWSTSVLASLCSEYAAVPQSTTETATTGKFIMLLKLHTSLCLLAV
jgi:tRNA wybutosine-synthesizing protein 1